MGLLGEDMDPRTQGLLALGFGLLNSRGNLGQALGQAGPQAMQAMAEARQQQQRAQQFRQQQEMQAVQMQQAQMQLQEAQRQAQQREKMAALAQQFSSTPQQMAMQNGQGPTVANAEAAQTASPGFDFQGYSNALAGIDPMGALNMQAALKKDDTPIALADGGMLVTRSGRKLIENPKQTEPPSAIREYQFAVSQGYKGTFDQWDTARKRAGATNVSVSMDKGFGDAFAKDAAASLATSRDQARAAATTIQTLDRIGGTIDTGKVALGPTAKFETFGRQIADTIGIGGKDNAEKLANTRKVIQGAASLAMDGAAALKGQGQITEGERALVSRAAGGDIDSMTAPEVKVMLGVLRKVNAQRIAQHQSQLGNVGQQFKAFVPFYQVETPAAPTSVDSLLQKYGGK